MDLVKEREQLESYYTIATYTGELVIASLIKGIDDILAGNKRTIDIHDSTRSELEQRISNFYLNIEDYL